MHGFSISHINILVRQSSQSEWYWLSIACSVLEGTPRRAPKLNHLALTSARDWLKDWRVAARIWIHVKTCHGCIATHV